MARPLRIEYEDAYYHITTRGNEQKNIFKSDRDREKFLDYLESATERYSQRHRGQRHRGQGYTVDRRESKTGCTELCTTDVYGGYRITHHSHPISALYSLKKIILTGLL